MSKTSTMSKTSSMSKTSRPWETRPKIQLDAIFKRVKGRTTQIWKCTWAKMATACTNRQPPPQSVFVSTGALDWTWYRGVLMIRHPHCSYGILRFVYALARGLSRRVKSSGVDTLSVVSDVLMFFRQERSAKQCECRFDFLNEPRTALILIHALCLCSGKWNGTRALGTGQGKWPTE